jgi:hypothetical protein
MDPEQTFLRVHARLSGMLSQLLTPRIRLALEYLYLAGAVALFCLLVVMHTNFVQQVSIPPLLALLRLLPVLVLRAFVLAWVLRILCELPWPGFANVVNSTPW